jgi:hypothetical protein
VVRGASSERTTGFECGHLIFPEDPKIILAADDATPRRSHHRSTVDTADLMTISWGVAPCPRFPGATADKMCQQGRAIQGQGTR